MDRSTLLEFFAEYKSIYEEENFFIPQFSALLSEQNCFLRTHLPGHLTGSVWIVDDTQQHVLLVHHAKLNKWVQPGGHADGEEDIKSVALREGEEETGVTQFELLNHQPFDVDIHIIPARHDFPQHLHYDIRFLLKADKNDPLLVSEESHDVKWIPLAELEHFNSERSVIRMKEKLLGAYKQ